MRRPLPVFLVLILPVLAAAACGYRFQPGGGGRFSDPSVRMDLSPFVNDSTEPDAGSLVAAKLREELRRRGFRGSFGPADADYVATGKVLEFRDEVLSHTASRFGLEYRFTLAVTVRLVDARSGNVLWRDEVLREVVSYYSGSDPQYTESNRRAALEEAVRIMVTRMAQTIRLIL